ncbi:MAG: ABC transporter permease subunit [Isosphaeraceae bacterium]|nr:ABC transporter permease subunit [Isosphaeraceae bacterium]
MSDRAAARLGRLALLIAWLAVIGWPALATVLAAGAREPDGGGGLMVPSAADLEAGRVQRPLALARTTVSLVLMTEALVLPPGVLLAILLFRTDVWGRRVLLGLLALVLFVPLPLHATAWLGTIGNAGRMQAVGSTPILVRLPGAAFVHALFALPWVVLITGVGLRTVERELEESALLDMPAWRVLWRVSLRRSLGALLGAALAVAVLTAGDMTVTDLLQVRSYAEESYLQLILGQGAKAAIVALPPMVVLGACVLLAARGLLRSDPARLASSAARARVWALGRWRIPLGLGLVLLAGNVVALPLYGLVWRAGRVGGRAAQGMAPHWSIAGLLGTMQRAAREVQGPLVESTLWAALAASATVALAWAFAWVTRRPGIWRWAVAGSLALLLSVPGPIAGLALKIAYGPEWAAVASHDLPALGVLVPLLRVLSDSPLMIVFAMVVRTLPYALLVLWPAVRSVPSEHLEAAALDGHGPGGQIVHVALPLTGGAVLAAWGVAFALGLGELPASNIASPPLRLGQTTLSLLVWSLLHTGVESHLAGVALVMLAAIASAGLLAAWALRRLGRP